MPEFLDALGGPSSWTRQYTVARVESGRRCRPQARGRLLVGGFLGALLGLMLVVASPGYALSCRHDFVETGFSVVDGTIPPVRFCSEFDRLGGVDTLGFPVSVPFKLTDGFHHYQAFQRAILQWQPDGQRADVGSWAASESVRNQVG